MYTLKGFITHATLASNVPGAVSTIGELSNQSMTFSREKGIYTSGNAAGLTLVSFLSAQDTTLVQATSTTTEHVLGIAKWIYDKTISVTAQMYADQLLTQLLAQYGAVAQDFECGEIVFDGRYYMPQFVAWTSKLSALGANRIKVWFSDAAFAQQYDEFEIRIVPPIDTLNDFFRTGAAVEASLNAATLPVMGDKTQAAKQGSPETIMRYEAFTYIDPLNPTHTVTSNWGMLIYGPNGNNIDAIKDALVNYILAHSTHTRVEWTAILPDVFKRTEFILVPLWDQYAIPALSVQAGIYSPLVALTAALQKFAAVVAAYPSAHINSHAAVLAHPYKSLQILACGGPENRDAKYSLADFFADYIAVSSTSIDFNRQALNTQNWALMLEELLLAAESVTTYASVPVGVSKTTRDGVLYVVRSFDNVHYLVAAKSSIDT